MSHQTLRYTHILFSPIYVKMMSATSVMILALMLTATFAQRSSYIRGPWDQTIFGGAQTGNSVSQVTTSSSSIDGLDTRQGTIAFRYFNNVPIQGPEDPCLSCTYRLTGNGFVRVQ
ncbi:hypothetical protein B566_EDAN007536 [Ephemera danica]|nr:hypothetical protein B566_EDAN007536 [Ephemera danica]